MLKKSLHLLIVSMLLFAGAAGAVGNGNPGYALMPGDAFFDAVLAIEGAQYGLAGDPEERVGMQNEYAERRLLAMGQTGNPDDLAELLEGYQERERELRRLLEGLDGADGRLSDVLALVAQACWQRALRLGEMGENESLPAEAREGMKQAQAYQEMAMSKLGEALAQQARNEEQHQAGQDNAGGNKAGGPGPSSGAGRP